VEEQIAIIFASTKGFTDSVPVEKMRDFESLYINEMRLQHAATLEELRKGNLTDTGQEVMKKVALDVASRL
jgi:F-type H+-transporting ATPase subunit alpha